MLLLAGLALAGCQPEPERVDAAKYDSFWLWAGVKPQPVLHNAKRVYILASAVSGRPARLIAQRSAVPRVEGPELWMVVRVETLDWPAAIMPKMLGQLRRWNAVGLQIDFDARTRGLNGYAEFLRDLRRQLPADKRLSITGLLDWSANGDTATLNNLAGVVDEIVIQTYQGRQTIPGYAKYFRNLERVHVPFRVGLVQGGGWDEPASLRRHPMMRGYVVFLVNQAGTGGST